MDQESKERVNNMSDAKEETAIRGHSHYGPVIDRETGKVGWDLGYSKCTVSNSNSKRFFNLGYPDPSDHDKEFSVNHKYDAILYRNTSYQIELGFFNTDGTYIKIKP